MAGMLKEARRQERGRPESPTFKFWGAGDVKKKKGQQGRGEKKKGVPRGSG